MDDLLKADIFFFITSIAVVVVSVLLAVALWYVIRILRAISDITERVREGSEMIAEDAARLREQVANGSLFSSIIGRFIAGRATRRRAPRKHEEE